MLICCQVGAALLLLGLAVADFAEIGPKFGTAGADNADKYADSVGYCIVLLGIAYYLGRTRRPPGYELRLNRRARIVTTVPIWGLAQIPLLGGVGRDDKRRLYVRNLAITAGAVVVWSSWTDLRGQMTGSAVAMAVLQIAGIALAIVMSRTLPAKDLQAARLRPRQVEDTNGWRLPPIAETSCDMQPADEIIDVSPLATDAHRLYWLAGSVKFGVVFLALNILASPHAGLFHIATMCGAILLAFGIAMLIQEDWIRPIAGVVLALVLIFAIYFLPTAFGIHVASNSVATLIGWAIWPGLFLWLYVRQRQSSGFTDAEIQAASRVGHLPRRQAGQAFRRLPPPGLWVRGALGMVCAIPVMIVSLFNAIFGAPVISGWVQSALDGLYAFARGSVGAWLIGARPDKRTSTILAMPSEPGMWPLAVRGDMLGSGKLSIPMLSPSIVSFEGFLRTRLETYGDVRVIDEAPRSPGAESAKHTASLIVMPVGVPYSSDVLNKLAVLGTQNPLLLVAQSMGHTPLRNWPLLASQMRDAGVALPAIDDPIRTIAVLVVPDLKKIIYLANRRDQWGYMAAVHEAFSAIGTETQGQVVQPGQHALIDTP